MKKIAVTILLALLTLGATTSAMAAGYRSCHRVEHNHHWHRVCR